MLDANKYDESISLPSCGSRTPFRGVRIASYPEDARSALRIAEKLHDKGYEVFLNLMTFSEWQKEHFDILRKWKNKKILSCIYFVDSFGSFVPGDISKHFRKLNELGYKSIGYHGHNSLQMAFANTLQAMEEGAAYVDATIYGMGRGSGNLPIEILLSYLQKQGHKKYNVVPYLDVIERFYLKLFQEHKWGYSLKSLLGGIKNIHPYYIDELVKLHSYTIEEIWNALDCIKENCPISYSGEKLKTTLGKRFYIPTEEQAERIVKEIGSQIKIFPAEDAFSLDELQIKDRHKGKKFLIIANGPSILRYKDKILKYIKENDPITIGCNFLEKIFEPDYHVFVSKKRFLKYASAIGRKSKLIVPTFFGRNIVDENYKGESDYIEIRSTGDLNSKPIEGIAQKSVYLNVAVAAILAAYQMGAKEIMAVGMDGYEKEGSKEIAYFYDENDVPDEKLTASFRYEKLAQELKRVNEFLQSEGIPFSIITPTSHKKYFKNIFHK
jgi:4-hydroxy 2-oxovalerate aldolase